jgi:hypothetical protein
MSDGRWWDSGSWWRWYLVAPVRWRIAGARDRVNTWQANRRRDVIKTENRRSTVKFLSGKISDMIRGGKLPGDVHVTGARPEADDRPSARAVRDARGQGLGKGATRARNGDKA